MRTVIDKGSGDDAGPQRLQMHEHDASHAVAADPERYAIEDTTAAERRALLRSRMTVEARVAALETFMDEVLAENEPESEVVEPAPETEQKPEQPLTQDEI